jgi:hypothetical protein
MAIVLIKYVSKYAYVYVYTDSHIRWRTTHMCSHCVFALHLVHMSVLSQIILPWPLPPLEMKSDRSHAWKLWCLRMAAFAQYMIAAIIVNGLNFLVRPLNWTETGPELPSNRSCGNTIAYAEATNRRSVPTPYWYMNKKYTPANWHIFWKFVMRVGQRVQNVPRKFRSSFEIKSIVVSKSDRGSRRFATMTGQDREFDWVDCSRASHLLRLWVAICSAIWK